MIPRRPRLVPIVAAVALALAAMAPSARAERRRVSPEARIERLHEQGLEAYSNMEMDQAAELLEQAIAVATRERLTGELRARLHVSLATVLILGQGRLADGREHLVTAATESEAVEPDPMLSAPLLDQVWQDVVGEVRPGRDEPLPPPRRDEDAREPEVPPPTFGRARLVHSPVRAQEAGHAVPVYVELQQVPGVRRVILAYRTAATSGWLSVDMVPHGDGLAARIPCHRVQGPRLEYFVDVTTEAGAEVTGGGSRDEPFRVEVLDELTAVPPRLPGEEPEPPCSRDRSRPRERPLDRTNRIFYLEAQLGTGAGVPSGQETRTCAAGSDLISVSPSLSWTELVLLPELGFYVGRHVSLGARARLQVPGAVFSDAPFVWGLSLRARWFVLPEEPLRVFVHLGAGYGTVAHRIELTARPGVPAPCGLVHYKQAGPGVVALGAGLFYDVVRNFAIGADLTLSFFVPDFAVQGDLALALHVSF